MADFRYGAPDKWTEGKSTQEQLIGGFGSEICRIIKFSHRPRYMRCSICGLSFIHLLAHIHKAHKEDYLGTTSGQS